MIQNIDTRGFTPRTFAIDPSGRLLVVGNQVTRQVRNGAGITRVPANLSLFRIDDDGRLACLRRYDVGVGDKPLWWAGLVACASYLCRDLSASSTSPCRPWTKCARASTSASLPDA